jgi:hypothetical protein
MLPLYVSTAAEAAAANKIQGDPDIAEKDLSDITCCFDEELYGCKCFYNNQ